MLSVQLSIIKLVFRDPCVVKARFVPWTIIMMMMMMMITIIIITIIIIIIIIIIMMMMMMVMMITIIMIIIIIVVIIMIIKMFNNSPLKMNYNVFTMSRRITKILLGLEFTIQLKIVRRTRIWFNHSY